MHADQRLQWYDAIWYPTRPLHDPRVRPGHHALLLGLHRLTAPYVLGERDFYEYGDDGHAVPFVESVVLRRARIGVQALPRYRLDLTRWGYVRYRQRPGYPSLYDVVAHADVSEPGLYFPVPLMVCEDFTLKPGHIAAYLALAYAAEQLRHEELPSNAGELEAWETPMYGSRCVLRGKELDRYAGFRHSTTRGRYLNELVYTGHVNVIQKGKKQRPGKYRLLSNEAADEALRAFLREADERWWQQYEAGELPYQQEGAT
jgi:hypothetical protein